MSPQLPVCPHGNASCYQCGAEQTRARVATLEAENARLRAERDEARFERDSYITAHNELEEANKALRGDLERVTGVVLPEAPDMLDNWCSYCGEKGAHRPTCTRAQKAFTRIDELCGEVELATEATAAARRSLEEAVRLLGLPADHDVDDCKCCCGYELYEPCGFAGRDTPCWTHGRAAFLASHSTPEPIDECRGECERGKCKTCWPNESKEPTT